MTKPHIKRVHIKRLGWCWGVYINDIFLGGGQSFNAICRLAAHIHKNFHD